MNNQLPSESTENTRHIDIDVTIDPELRRHYRRMREHEAAWLRAEEAALRAEEAALRSAAECNALLAMGIGFLLGGCFFGDE